ncbi:hypothetical protein ABI_18660 [Asticcacaulis biprosthecium C19]|uniref:Uncharacterized protein n=2 Tax=Asticcacaulis biprosthecium TaxID=76891 RepID=F4QL51_9CAUL|nr:hypothetical protein ABI_18660 [Asticcacaulis biprosthecium C19]
MHRVLEVLAEGNPELVALGTIVHGSQPVAEAGMGIQYFYSAEVLRIMAEAYSHVTSDALVAAIDRIRPEFDPRSFECMPAIILEKFAVIRHELSVVADKGWAMIAGMF